MTTETQSLKPILEAALLAAGTPQSLEKLQQLFPEESMPEKQALRDELDNMFESYDDSAFALRKVASGYVFQVKQEYAPYVVKLWEEKPARYSRALLETLAIIAYRQPATRGEVEEIRGVAVSTSIMKTLQERDWVKVIGHRDVPGKPAIYGTTKEFLDYFNLTNLDELPTLQEIKDLDQIANNLDPQLELDVRPAEEGIELAAEAASIELSEQEETDEYQENENSESKNPIEVSGEIINEDDVIIETEVVSEDEGHIESEASIEIISESEDEFVADNVTEVESRSQIQSDLDHSETALESEESSESDRQIDNEVEQHDSEDGEGDFGHDNETSIEAERQSDIARSVEENEPDLID